MPNHDVYGRVFVRLNPEEIGKCFMARVRDIRLPAGREDIAIDGKTMRGSTDNFRALKAAHIVSAYAAERRITPARMKSGVKSNGITATPELSGLFAMRGRIVTIDTTGCRYAIVCRIAGSGADYLFLLKGNQETLHGEASKFYEGFDFRHPDANVKGETKHDTVHGRELWRLYIRQSGLHTGSGIALIPDAV